MIRRGGALVLGLGAALALGGCASGPPPAVGVTYELSAAPHARLRPPRARFRLGEPFAPLALDRDAIVVRETPLRYAMLADARWPERLPTLLRDRLGASFAAAGLAHVIDDDGETARFELDLQIRDFELDLPSRSASVDVLARLVRIRDDKTVATRDFAQRVRVASTAPPHVAAALNEASRRVLAEIVVFAARALDDP